MFGYPCENALIGFPETLAGGEVKLIAVSPNEKQHVSFCQLGLNELVDQLLEISLDMPAGRLEE